MAESSSSTLATVTFLISGVDAGDSTAGAADSAGLSAGSGEVWGPTAAAQPPSSNTAASSSARVARLIFLYVMICSNLSFRFRFSVAKEVATSRRGRELAARVSRVSP